MRCSAIFALAVLMLAAGASAEEKPTTVGSGPLAAIKKGWLTGSGDTTDLPPEVEAGLVDLAAAISKQTVKPVSKAQALLYLVTEERQRRLKAEQDLKTTVRVLAQECSVK